MQERTGADGATAPEPLQGGDRGGSPGETAATSAFNPASRNLSPSACQQLVRAAARHASSGRRWTSKACRGRARTGHPYRFPSAPSTHPSLEVSSSAMAAVRRPGAGSEGGAAAAGSAAKDSATAAAPAITGSSLSPARPPPASSPRRPPTP